MITRPVCGLEKETIDAGVTEGERIEIARLISFHQGGVDERWNLCAFIRDKGRVARFVLALLLKPWFVRRARETHGHGLSWNMPYDEDSPLSDGK